MKHKKRRRLIDANELKTEIKSKLNDLMSIIDEQPTFKTPQATWLSHKCLVHFPKETASRYRKGLQEAVYYYCSRCAYEVYNIEKCSNYCPQCGASMSVEKERE